MDKEYGFTANDKSHGFPIFGTVIKNNMTDAKTVLTLKRKPDVRMVEMNDND